MNKCLKNENQDILDKLHTYYKCEKHFTTNE